MDMDKWYGVMAQTMLDNGRTEKSMGKAN